jgi:hypothetical protein
LKHFRKTIAATMTAIAVAGVTMASAPPASAGDPLPLPPPEWMRPVDAWDSYGLLPNGDPIIGRSLNPESIDAIDNFRQWGDQPLTSICMYLDQFRYDGQTCIDVILNFIQQEQAWYQPPSWMRVVSEPSGGYVIWYYR